LFSFINFKCYVSLESLRGVTYLAELAGNALSARQKDQAAAECFRKKENNVFKCLGFLSVAYF